MAYPNQVQPQYYQFNQDTVQQQLSCNLRQEVDRDLLHTIFESPEWKSQRNPIPEALIRQLRHRLELPSGVVFACPFCVTTDKEANHMTEHIQQEHFGLKLYPCSEPTCGHMSLRRSDMIAHFNTHSPEEIYCPRGCGQVFNSEKNIKRHLNNTCRNPAV